MADVVAMRRPRANALGRYPSRWTAAMTRSRVASVILSVGTALSTRDTTLGFTAARAATSRRVGARGAPSDRRAALTGYGATDTRRDTGSSVSPRDRLPHEGTLGVVRHEAASAVPVDGAGGDQPGQEVIEQAGVPPPAV